MFAEGYISGEHGTQLFLSSNPVIRQTVDCNTHITHIPLIRFRSKLAPIVQDKLMPRFNATWHWAKLELQDGDARSAIAVHKRLASRFPIKQVRCNPRVTRIKCMAVLE